MLKKIDPALRERAVGLAPEHISEYPSIAKAIFEYIEMFHNRWRRRSTLGYRSLIEHETTNSYARSRISTPLDG